jgi:hypothetical protein
MRKLRVTLSDIDVQTGPNGIIAQEAAIDTCSC